MREQAREYIISLLAEIVTIDTQLILLAVLIVAAVIVLDAISAVARKKSKETGLDTKTKWTTVSIDGSKTLPSKSYISDMQGLAGKPDALLSENGFIIPVERKPLSKKLRDRHIAQLLVYMRLVEEFEGKKPPYGYLLLGSNCRRIKIQNTEARQAWLQKMIDEMQACLEHNILPTPAPHPKKCRRCNVRASCEARIDEQPVQIGNSQHKRGQTRTCPKAA